MLHAINVAAILAVLGAVTGLYGLKYETRRIETRVQRLERAAEKAEADIAVLKAERAYLARPERIEKLARLQGLEPVREHQYLRIGEAYVDGIARILDLAEPPDPAEVEERE